MSPRSHPTISRLVAVLLTAVLAGGLATSVASAGSLPPCRIGDVTAYHRLYGDWYRTLVDTEYRVTSGYSPGNLRSTADAGLNGGHRVRALVLADLRAMARAARAAGARLAVQSAYRSYSTQASTFAYWVRVQGFETAITESARAGHSEHQFGTTIDFRSYGGRAPWDYADWGRTKAGTWLRNHAWKYGFVMSYPKGKSAVTCYAYEPWHFRYVGRTSAAAIRASGLTVREYLWRQIPEPAPTPTPTATPEPTAMPEPDVTPDPAAAPVEEASPPAPVPDASPEATPAG